MRKNQRRTQRTRSSGEEEEEPETPIHIVTKRDHTTQVSRKGDETDKVEEGEAGAAVLILGGQDRGSIELDPLRSGQGKRSLTPEEAAAEAKARAREKAVKVSEEHTEHDRDARSIREKAMVLNKELKGTLDEQYRGANYYQKFIEAKESANASLASQKHRAGAARLPSHIRNTVRFDYQPHVCKDYKETGYCGFGDSCIFMHDRGDYKSGWELEKEWQEKQGRLKADPKQYYLEGDEDGEGAGEIGLGDQAKRRKTEADVDPDDDLPVNCPICHAFFIRPVYTKCQHVFCEACAIERFGQDPKCFVCETPTQGQFKPAKKDVVEKLKKKMAVLTAARQAAEAAMLAEVVQHDEDEDEAGDGGAA